MLLRYLMTCLVALVVASSAQAIGKGDTYDVLNLPASASPRATQSPLYGVALAGARLVAVGQRGTVVYSDDGGLSWSQADVPVRSTLLSVFFVNADKGWAVGHDGVILHSSDGGETWAKQFDGYDLIDTGLAYYSKLAQQQPDNESYGLLLEEFEFAREQGADKPFLKVLFVDDNTGFAFGAYGIFVATTDGGASWQPLMEYGEQEFRHTFDYEIVGDNYYLSQEMGYILMGQTGGGRAQVKSIIPFYDGSFYTMTSSTSGDLVVAGLRANAFRSVDNAATWQHLELPINESVTASARLGDGRIVLASQGGDVLLSEDDGASFNIVAQQDSFAYSDVIEYQPGKLLLVGLGGLRTLSLDQ